MLRSDAAPAMSLDPVIGILLLSSFAILFASAALHKWRNLQQFEAVLAAYRVLPSRSWLRLHAVVPALESLIALGLLTRATYATASAAGAVLLSGYAGAMALNLLRGRRDIACGCGGPDERRTIAAWMVWRNLLLALLLCCTLWSWSRRPLLPTDWVTIGFGVAAAVVIYLCIDRLGLAIRNAKALQGTR
jgi:Methylamine utilisation protein MauE